MTAVVAPKIWLSNFVGYQQTNNWHTTPPKTHISFIVPHPKGIDCRQKSETGKIRVGNELPLVITGALITNTVTKISMSCHHR